MLPDALGTAHGTQLVMDMLVIIRLSLAITTSLIDSEAALNSLRTSLEVTLFRSDRQMWTKLQQVVIGKHRSRAIVILNGKPDANKWLHISCVTCGRYLFVPYSTKGTNAQSAEKLARGREKIFEFFQLPYRAQQSALRRQV